jgi:hypothetical protein
LNPKLVTTYIVEPQAMPTTYIIEPQASHQQMPICEIETSLAQDDLYFDHTPIYDYL